MASITLTLREEIGVDEIVNSASNHEREELLRELITNMSETDIQRVLSEEGFGINASGFLSVPADEYIGAVTKIAQSYMSISSDDQNTIMAIAAKY